LAAIFWSWAALQNKRLRVLAIFFWTSLFLGSAFGGGVGVWVNTYFDLNLSIAIIVGLMLHQVWEGQIGKKRAWLAVAAPVALLLSFVPVWLAGPPLFQRAISSLAEKHNRFESEVSFLRAHPGPAFCASLLRCYEAGKPYVYDPFNSTNLIKHGKLDATSLIDRLNRGELAAVQLCCSIEFLREDDALTQLVIPQVLSALETSYELGLAHEGCYIYVPRSSRARPNQTARIEPQSPTGERAGIVIR
jgi:hypothetical protein